MIKDKQSASRYKESVLAASGKKINKNKANKGYVKIGSTLDLRSKFEPPHLKI